MELKRYTDEKGNYYWKMNRDEVDESPIPQIELNNPSELLEQIEKTNNIKKRKKKEKI